jgi:glycosyltransferase involved in cell wall biosynthesis
VTGVRIGYTCHDAFPATSTNTQQIFWTLTEIARLGPTVDLCVPAIRGNGDVRPRLARHYATADVRIPDSLRIVPLGDTPPAGPFARAVFDLLAPRRFSPGTHDLLWTRDPLALVAALRRGVPTVFETYRPDFAAAGGFAIWRLACLQRRSLAGVITHSRLAADAFRRAGVADDRVLVAHNGHAPSLMSPVLDAAAARTRLGLSRDAPLVVYTGHVGPQKGTDALISLAAALPHVTFVIVGVDEGRGERRWIEGRAIEAGAVNLRLVPRVAVAEVAPYLYAADCLVIPPTDEPLARYGRTVLPMKVFAYLAAGRPILAPRLPDLEEVLTDGITAVLVPPGDVRAAAAALSEVLADRARAARLGEAAKAASVQFTWAARAEKIAAFLARRLAADARR